jgi:IPT/TIG domain
MPDHGPTSGNTYDTITGLNFIPAAYLEVNEVDSAQSYVTIGGSQCAAVEWVNSTQVVCVTPVVVEVVVGS